VTDTLYVGGESVDEPLTGGSSLAMPFVFGCQTFETGLFRTQLENGIMGLSNQELTLVPKLKVRAGACLRVTYIADIFLTRCAGQGEASICDIMGSVRVG
jgi:hypothetical protein